ncbi:MAG: flagellar export chaperone FliS [Pseudomonadota bacterium]|jgi:flagellar protein FliS|nr:flagellar export chaperone FliS [Xanthomonadaceae bacterium]MDE2247447.1 flagellar export chaperone FliS [Xanthomonadaceae bacterium]MDE3209287.1 flagellar export chaperone FliS [Pseudomonadota bacterium]
MTNGYMRKASAIYQQNSVRGVVEGADPHQLVNLLLNGVIDRIRQARGHMAHGDVAAKGRTIAGAVGIVNELRNSLDHKVDAGLTQRLDSLYEYVSRRLLIAQLHDDAGALDEVVDLLTPIRDGWLAIRPDYVAAGQRAAGGGR